MKSPKPSDLLMLYNGSATLIGLITAFCFIASLFTYYIRIVLYIICILLWFVFGMSCLHYFDKLNAMCTKASLRRRTGISLIQLLLMGMILLFVIAHTLPFLLRALIVSLFVTICFRIQILRLKLL